MIRTIAGAVVLSIVVFVGDSWALELTPSNELAVRYEFSIDEGEGDLQPPTSWILLRSTHRIITAIPEAGQQEIWERDIKTGSIALRRVFHKARRVVEYTPGQLNSMGSTVSWESLFSIIEPSSLATMERSGTEPSVAGDAVVYRFKRGKLKVEIAWVAELGLPVRIERWGRDAHSVLKAVAVGAPGEAPWSNLAAMPETTYDILDAADFGDMDNDPFVREVEALDARSGRWMHGGQAHAH